MGLLCPHPLSHHPVVPDVPPLVLDAVGPCSLHLPYFCFLLLILFLPIFSGSSVKLVKFAPPLLLVLDIH